MGDTLNSLLEHNRSSTVLQGIANPAQINPLAAMTSAAQTAGTIYNLRKLQAEQAAGQAYQGAIDPATGEFNPNRLRTLLSQDPTAALAAGAALANTQSISSDQLNQARAKAVWANSAAGSLTRLGPNLTTQDAISALHDGLTQGILTQPEYDRQVAEVTSLGNDPAKLHAWASQHQFTAMSTQQQLDQGFGTIGTQTGPNGNTIGFVQQPASRGGGVSAGPQPGAPQGMSPAELNEIILVPYPRLNPDGTPNPNFGRSFPMRKGDYVTLLPGAAQVQPGGGGLPPSLRNPANAPPAATTPPAPPGASTAPPATVGNTGIGAVLAPGGAAAAPLPLPPTPPAVVPPPPATTAAPAIPPTPAPLPYGPRASNQLVPSDVAAIMGGMDRARATPVTGTAAAGPAASTPTYFGTAPSAADIELQKRQVEQGTTGFQAITDQAVASRPRSAILGNMLGDTTQFTSGPLASRIETVRAVANRFGIPVNTEGLSAQESFNKLAAQLANAQGANSDARLNVNVAANPHQELSPAGVDLMVRQLQGNEDYLQVRAKLAASYPDQTDIKKFENEVGAKVDPRAFQFARMTPAQRQAYDKGLSATDRAAVKSSYNWLANQGLVGN